MLVGENKETKKKRTKKSNPLISTAPFNNQPDTEDLMMAKRTSRRAKLSRIARNFGDKVIDLVTPKQIQPKRLVPVPVEIYRIERRPISGSGQ